MLRLSGDERHQVRRVNRVVILGELDLASASIKSEASMRSFRRPVFSAQGRTRRVRPADRIAPERRDGHAGTSS